MVRASLVISQLALTCALGCLAPDDEPFADASQPDAALADVSAPDTESGDAFAEDLGSADLGSPDAGGVDGDVGAGSDAAAPDALPADADPADTDAAVLDGSEPSDADPADLGSADASAPDASAPDASAPDASTPDAGPPDSGLVHGADYDYVFGSSAFYEPSGAGGLGFFNVFDVSAVRPLPFAFTYFGTTYPAGTNLYITSNGTVFFGSGDTDGVNTTLPRTSGTPGVIAAFWTRLRHGGDAGIYSTSDAVTIRWYNATANDARDNIIFELRLVRNLNLIQMRYYQDPDGFSATIGIEAPDGSRALQLPCSPNCGTGMLPGTELTFIPAGTTVPNYNFVTAGSRLVSAPSPLYPGESIQIEPVLGNVGLSASPGVLLWVLRSTAPYYSLLDTATTLDDAFVGPLAPGASMVLPPRDVVVATQPGTYRLGVWADLESAELFGYDNLTELGVFTVSPFIANIVISTSSLPSAQVGVPYAAQLAASGSPSPTWSSTPLPSGLSLSAGGLLSGTPTQAGVTGITFTAEERGYRSDSTQLFLTVSP